MEPVDDVDLGSEPPPPRWEASRESWAPLGIAAAVIVVIALLVAWFWFRRAAEEPKRAAAETPKAVAPAASRPGLGPTVAPIDLPPLVLTDPLVRDLVGKLSSRPELAAWLATDGLIRTFVVCVDNVAAGATPARHLPVLQPKTAFKAEAQGRGFVTDPRSFSRYDGLAGTVASLDPAGLARTYSMLKPRLIDAYKELGHPDGDFDAAVEKAIVMLLQTPVSDGTDPLISKVLSYKYEREELESLEPAQKQLLRMGPRNVQTVQGQLRAIARELGIPNDRLPPRAGAGT
jgi:hypothetical protein